MATISGATVERVFPLGPWRGLNENPDGDTKLKSGEASVMLNWRVTRDGNLKRRPGTETVAGLRIAYTAVASGTSTEACRTTGDETVNCYDSVFCNTMGLLETGNLVGAFTPTQAAAYSGGNLYVNGERGIYLLTRIETENDTSTWNGLRMKAEPTAGDTKPVAGLWTGNVNGKKTVLAACDNRLWSLWDADNAQWQKVSLGIVNTSGTVRMFPFGGNVYILSGHEYMQFDGTEYKAVEGYRPLVAIAISPLVDGEAGTADSGELHENINLLNGFRRAWLSPDGEGNNFQLPETGIASIDWVKDLKTGQDLPASAYSCDLATGVLTMSSVPAKAVNSLEVAWTMATTYRSLVEGMRYSEMYAGTQDTRVFLYGDGTNQAIYSGLDYNGTPRADYFPDQNSVHVGDSNTPITAMIRHYSSLICYKSDSAWAITFGITTLATDVYTPAFYSTPINRAVGNVAAGQVYLVDNSPITAFGHELYGWRNSGAYANLTSDERQAKRISDRIQKSLGSLDLNRAIMWDDNDHQEFYLCAGDKALVWNYAADAWTRYSGLHLTCFMNFNGVLYAGTADGRVIRFADEANGDDAEIIHAVWHSGALSFGQDFMRKQSARVWVGLKPQDGSSITVTGSTDRKESLTERIIGAENTRVSGEPFMTRTKLKAKKFVYYRLILESNEYAPAPTVNAVDIRVRFSGYAK